MNFRREIVLYSLYCVVTVVAWSKPCMKSSEEINWILVCRSGLGSGSDVDIVVDSSFFLLVVDSSWQRVWGENETLEAGTFGDQFLAVSLFGQAEEQWQRWHGNFQLYLQLLLELQNLQEDQRTTNELLGKKTRCQFNSMLVYAGAGFPKILVGVMLVCA